MALSSYKIIKTIARSFCASAINFLVFKTDQIFLKRLTLWPVNHICVIYQDQPTSRLATVAQEEFLPFAKLDSLLAAQSHPSSILHTRIHETFAIDIFFNWQDRRIMGTSTWWSIFLSRLSRLMIEKCTFFFSFTSCYLALKVEQWQQQVILRFKS